MSLYNHRGYGLGPAHKSHEDYGVNKLISDVVHNIYKRSEMEVLKDYKDGTITREEFIKKLKRIINIYKSEEPSDKNSSDFYRWKANTPYTTEEMTSLLEREGAIDTGMQLVNVVKSAFSLLDEKFKEFDEVRTNFPNYYNSLTIGETPYKEEISSMRNKYFDLLFNEPLKDFKNKGTNMSLENFSKKISEFQKVVEHMPEEIETLKVNHNAKTKLPHITAVSAINLSKKIDMRKVELDRIIKDRIIVLLEFADSDKNTHSLDTMTDIKEGLEAYKNGTLEDYKPVVLKSEDLKMIFSTENFRKAAELTVDIYNQRHRGLITEKYKYCLESKNPKIEEKERYYAEVKTAIDRQNQQRLAHYSRKPKDGYFSIEDYIAELETYQAQVIDEENEASYQYVDSSDLIFLIEKMNHNPRNLAQVKAAKQLRAGEKVTVPEGDYSPEDIERLFESPSARKLTNMMIETNDKMYEDAYSLTEDYSTKKEKMPVKLSPFEELGNNLDDVHRQHMTRIAGPQTAKKYFPEANHRFKVFSNYTLNSGSFMYNFPDTVHSLEDIGSFQGSNILPFRLSDYKIILESYCYQNAYEIKCAKAEEKSSEISAMKRKDRKSLAERININRDLKKELDRWREKCREDERKFAEEQEQK